MRRVCIFDTIEDQFNFGRYKGLSLADVLDINPSYLDWCVKHCTGILFILYDEAVAQIKQVYPHFFMDKLFESCRIDEIELFECGYSDDSDMEVIDTFKDYWNEPQTYDRYAGSWAQDIGGYSDNDIDTIFDGDPSAYWNID